MLRRFFIVRDRRKLIAAAAVAPLALLGLYWFAVVGLSNPASRLKKDIEAHARETRVVRVPATFIHRPINQWTRPLKNFHLELSGDGSIRMGFGEGGADRYSARLDDRVGVAGEFSFRNIGSGVEIELMPGGRTVDVASIKPLP
jgi:hypothetical protein